MALAPAPVGDPNAVRDAIAGILADPAYAGLEEHWYSPILRFLGDPVGYTLSGVEWLFSQLAGGASAGIVPWLIVVVAIVLVGLGVWRLTRSVRTDERAVVSVAPGIGQTSAADFERQADDFDQQQAWREAVRARYSALLARLSERGVVQARPGRTTGEYLQDVRTAAPFVGDAFAEATALFEWIWYGDRDAANRDSVRMRELSAQVLSEVRA